MNALLRGLPPQGALHRALDPEGWSWTFTDELLSMIAQLIDYSNRLYFRAQTKPGTRQPPPLEIKRPWEEERRKAAPPPKPKPKPSHEHIVSFFGGKR